jgi:fructokinase
LDRYTWRRTAEGYLAALTERQRNVDETEREIRAASGTASFPAAEDIAPSGGPQSATPGSRLAILRYFFDPRPETEIAIHELDDLYLQLDVLAVGETVVDFISAERVRSLRTASRFSRYLGGQPANVALYAAKLGGRAAVLGKVGKEYFGEFLEEQLQRHGVSTEALLRADTLPTTTVFITLTNSGSPDFQVNRGADVLLDIREVPESLIQRARAVHTSVFALSQEPQRSAIRRALRLAHRNGKLVSLDPNYSPRVWADKEEAWEVIAEVLPHVTVVKPSLDDARRLFDPTLSDDALEAACLRQFHDLGAKVVIVTRSGGLVTVSDGQLVQRVGPLPTVRVENVTGGRDAFWSALLIARLDGHPWPFCVRFAHEVAALKLRVVGHVERMIDRTEIYKRLNEG